MYEYRSGDTAAPDGEETVFDRHIVGNIDHVNGYAVVLKGHFSRRFKVKPVAGVVFNNEQRSLIGFVIYNGVIDLRG